MSCEALLNKLRGFPSFALRIPTAHDVLRHQHAHMSARAYKI